MAHCVVNARSFARERVGSSMLARMAIIAITTSNSINVNADRHRSVFSTTIEKKTDAGNGAVFTTFQNENFVPAQPRLCAPVLLQQNDARLLHLRKGFFHVVRICIHAAAGILEDVCLEAE